MCKTAIRIGIKNYMSKNISRREFLKTMGVAGIATTGLASCVGTKKDAKDSPEGEVPKDKMT